MDQTSSTLRYLMSSHTVDLLISVNHVTIGKVAQCRATILACETDCEFITVGRNAGDEIIPIINVKGTGIRFSHVIIILGPLKTEKVRKVKFRY